MQDFSQFHNFIELVEKRALEQYGQTKQSGDLSASDYATAEISILKEAQATCFTGEIEALTAGKPLPSNSRLFTLAPELHKSTDLIRVGDRLRHSDLLDQETAHPIILEPKHQSSILMRNYITQGQKEYLLRYDADTGF